MVVFLLRWNLPSVLDFISLHLDVGGLEVTLENYSANSSIVALDEFGDHDDKWSKAVMEVPYDGKSYSLLIHIRANTSETAFLGKTTNDGIRTSLE